METAFVITIGGLLALNIAATRAVLAVSAALHGRARWLLAAIWIAPVFGAAVALVEARSARAKRAPPRDDAAEQGPAPDAALPLALSAAGLPDLPLLEHMHAPRGLPVLDWAALDGWLAGLDAAAEPAAVRNRARMAWLQHLRHAMGPDAEIVETPHALVLSTMEPRVARAAADFIDRTRRRVALVLKGAARLPEHDKSLLIVFDTEEDYYDYVSVYYPEEGEFAVSSGMFIHAGCPHFVVVQADLSSIEPTIAHELTHSALTHLRLPKWLDEGIAVNTEIRLTGEKRLIYTPHELHAKHVAFWDEARIQEFWSGASFDRTDDGNLLSYELGRIIVDQLARDWDGFLRFVTAAQRADAGAAAAHSTFGTALGHYPSTLLGLGDSESWSPRPSAWAPAAA